MAYGIAYGAACAVLTWRMVQRVRTAQGCGRSRSVSALRIQWQKLALSYIVYCDFGLVSLISGLPFYDKPLDQVGSRVTLFSV
eukprot:457320-Rhodomonas_salina.1